jgi:hypothetical protein
MVKARKALTFHENILFYPFEVRINSDRSLIVFSYINDKEILTQAPQKRNFYES